MKCELIILRAGPKRGIQEVIDSRIQAVAIPDASSGRPLMHCYSRTVQKFKGMSVFEYMGEMLSISVFET